MIVETILIKGTLGVVGLAVGGYAGLTVAFATLPSKPLNVSDKPVGLTVLTEQLQGGDNILQVTANPQETVSHGYLQPAVSPQ